MNKKEFLEVQGCFQIQYKLNFSLNHFMNLDVIPEFQCTVQRSGGTIKLGDSWIIWLISYV